MSTKPQPLDAFKVPEHRNESNAQAAVLLMQELSKNVEVVHRELVELQRSVNYYRATQEESIEKAIDKAMNKAFPDGDPDGHRRAHEAAIRAAERRAEFWASMAKEIGKWGLISVLGWLVYIAWQAFLRGPSK